VERVTLSNPGKQLFPGDGITKADLAGYYEAVAEVLLPHVRDRPLSLQVHPAGIERPGHFMKNMPEYFPDWVRRVELPKKGGTVTHVVAENADTLRLLAQHNAIALHVPTARLDRFDRPDRLIVDLDPPDTGHWEDVVAGAHLTGGLLRDAGLQPFLMVTGSRGLHVVAPLRRDSGYREVFALGKDLATAVENADPDRFSLKFKIEEREGRVYVDVLRNRPAQTAVAPYSVRTKPGAPVATPITWDELDDPATGPAAWTLRTIAQRLEQHGDPWAEISAAAASPRSAAKRLAAAA
jgi:bifunctional non-homologous end joining protein LigD